MATLGTVPVYDPVYLPAEYVPITSINPRLPGYFLGVLPVADTSYDPAEYRRVESYRYRQQDYVYKPIWPRYGQRWPQGQSTF